MATDNFNRSNETPLAAPWTWNAVFAAMNLVNATQAASAGATAQAQGYYAGAASGPDQYSEYRVVAINPGESAAAVRHQTAVDATDCYLLYSDAAGDLTFFRITAPSSFTVIGATQTGKGGGVNDIMRFEVSGTTLTGKKNGVVQYTQSDGGLSTGQPGLHGYDTTGVVDDWAGGNLVTVTWEQEGYQWRRDDGTEVNTAGGATYIGAQDTPL